MTTLLVEDGPTEGMLLGTLIAAAGEVVVSVKSVAAALAVAEAPSLVVLDVGARGVTEVRALCTAPSLGGAPVLTVGAPVKSREAYRKAGAAATAARPLQAKDFTVLVRRLATACAHVSPAPRQAGQVWVRHLVHDLSSPLTVLGASIRLAESAGVSAKAAVALADARRAYGRLEDLLGAMLDVDRVMADGQLKTCLAESDLSALVQEVVDAVEPVAQLTGRRVVAGGVSGRGPLDADLVKRALINLVENALRYTPVDVPVVLSAHRKGQTVVFEVTDGGPGVPEGLRAQIFEPYQQGGERGGGVAGLGLAWCRLVAEAHGGDCTVRDAEAGGARFVLELRA